MVEQQPGSIEDIVPMKDKMLVRLTVQSMPEERCPYFQTAGGVPFCKVEGATPTRESYLDPQLIQIRCFERAEWQRCDRYSGKDTGQFKRARLGCPYLAADEGAYCQASGRSPAESKLAPDTLRDLCGKRWGHCEHYRNMQEPHPF